MAHDISEPERTEEPWHGIPRPDMRSYVEEQRAYMLQLTRTDTGEVIGTVGPPHWAVTSNALAWAYINASWKTRLRMRLRSAVVTPIQVTHCWIRHRLTR